VKLRYTLRGAAELDQILADLAQKSPQGARHVQMRIQEIIDLLLTHPHAGQLTSKGRLRRLGAYPYPYLIFYRASEDEVVIHGVRHGARNPPSMPSSD
jgi:toxin ParE1/3/4